jgi:hypothetical protein
MVVLEGADHVKYGMGSVGRMKRMAPSFQVVAARTLLHIHTYIYIYIYVYTYTYVHTYIVGRMKRMAPSFQVVAADLTKPLCQLTKPLTNQTSPN